MDDLGFLIPGIAAIAILFFYYFTSLRLPIKINRIFLRILVTEAFVITLESVVVLINGRYLRSVSNEVVYVLNAAFYVLYLFKSYQYFAFSANLVKIHHVRRAIVGILSAVWGICGFLAISSIWWNTVFKINEKRGFATGPLWPVVPGCAAFFVILAVIVVFVRRKHISASDLLGAVAFNTALLICAVIRFFIPQGFIQALIGILPVLICYLSYETPERYLSDRGAAFNKRAFKAILEESLEQKTYRALAFVLRDYSDERVVYGSAQMDKGISLIIDYLRRKYPKHLIFYLRNGYFVIYDPEALNLYRIRDDLYERFSQPWQAYDTELYLSISFIKVGAESNIESADMLINNLTVAFEKAGQLAMYGKDIYDLDNTRDIEEQARIKGALEYCVKNNTVEVYMQPVIDSETEELAGAEALARIRDEEGKIISPTAFIPLAERSGHVNSVGEQVFEKVCRFVNSNGFLRVKMDFVNVNLSPIQCLRSDLSDRFSEIIKYYKASPSRIHFEITEQSMGDSAIILKQVNKLRDCGFQFALDDFGSGYSNLTRLKNYPFKNVKLDMEIVRNYCKNRDPLILSIVNILKQMGYSITAEGIETKEMADIMKSIGCEYLQGYYYSRPLPIEEFVEKYAKT